MELANKTLACHIVGITGDIAEEEDTNKRRREEKMDDATAETPAENLRANFCRKLKHFPAELVWCSSLPAA